MAQLCTRTAPPGGASCCGSRRRTLLAGFGAVVATHPLLGNAAWASDEPVEFVDDKRRFGLQVPAEWQLKGAWKDASRADLRTLLPSAV